MTKIIKIASPFLVAVFMFGCAFTTDGGLGRAPSDKSMRILTSSVPNAVAQSSYDVTLAVQGGTAPYTWSVVAGQLPPGINLSGSSGVLLGTPTQTGQFSFSVRVTDSFAKPQSASQLLTMNVSAAITPLSITFSAFPSGISQNSYATAASATGGITPYVWSVVSGSLPPGLSLSSSTGAITGTPTVPGTYNLTVQVKDSSPTAQTETASASSSISIVAPLQISTNSLPTPQIQTNYSATLTTSGGMSPLVWSVSAGSLPAGLTLNSSTGVISGTPTTAGSYNFTIQVVDPPQIPQTASKAFTLNLATLAAPLQVTTTSLPAGQVQVAYNATLAATGGTAPYVWSLASGSLPSGLNLNASTGAITGTPAAAGTSPFTVQAKDSAATPQTATQALSITIASAVIPLQINTISLPGGQIQVSYQATLVASGGTAPYTWSVTSGMLPTLLALLSSTGLISGTPSTAGTFGFIVQVADSAGHSSSTNLSINIATPPPLSITTTSLPSGTVGTSYSGSLQATGGTQPYTWSVSSGQLPNGVSLAASSGIVSGTPAVSGTFSFTVQVTDAKSQVASLAFTVNIVAAPSGQTPATYSARTDLLAAPETLPSVACFTAASGVAPCIFTSSDLNPNVQYTRVTDGSTTSYSQQWQVANSIDRLWSHDNSTFMINGFQFGGTIFKFNSSTLLASPMPCSFGGLGCQYGTFIPAQYFNTSDDSYSQITANVMYGFVGTVLTKVDFRATYANGATAPTNTSIVDMAACSGMPSPAGYSSIVSVANNDTRFSSMTGGSQGAAYIVYTYDTTNGCRWLRTDTFVTGGAWGTTGAATCYAPNGSTVVACISMSDLHGAQMTPDGRWVVFSRTSTNNNYWWDLSTGNIYDEGDDAGSGGSLFRGGHTEIGLFNLVQSPGASDALILRQTAPNFTVGTYIAPTQPAGYPNTCDSHGTWKAQTTTTTPILYTVNCGFTPTIAWQDELLAIATDGSNTVWRIAHLYALGRDYGGSALICESDDGQYAIYSGDRNGSGRDDVFLIILK